MSAFSLQNAQKLGRALLIQRDREATDLRQHQGRIVWLEGGLPLLGLRYASRLCKAAHVA